MGCCWLTGVQIMPLGALASKFGVGTPAGMLMADGGTDNAFGGPGHQVWRRTP